jgi:hypothetical protein
MATDEAFAADYGLRKERRGMIGLVFANQRPDAVDPETGIKFKDGFPDYFNALVLLDIDTKIPASHCHVQLSQKILDPKCFMQVGGKGISIPSRSKVFLMSS